MEKSVLSIKQVYITEIAYKLNTAFKSPKKGIRAEIKCILYRSISNDSCTVKLRTEVFDRVLTETMPFFALINVQSEFKVDGKLEKEQLDRFATNMAAILYSYTRPLVAQITAFSNMPPLHLPIMDMRGIKIVDITDESSAIESKEE
jgi:preprotein translocase subunit SecB